MTDPDSKDYKTEGEWLKKITNVDLEPLFICKHSNNT